MAIEIVGRLEGNRSSSLLNHTFSSQVDGSTRDLRPFPFLHVAVRQEKTAGQFALELRTGTLREAGSGNQSMLVPEADLVRAG